MKTDCIFFGAAYYDEYLPYDRLDKDMEMMKKAGMNMIRIAESTWSTLEPQEGIYDFSHLDRMLDAAAKYDLKVIIGTPTYAIPSWLARKSDDILAYTHSGASIYGHRQNMDLTSPVYLKYAENIIRVLLQHVCNHPQVIGYQIDNETHHYDTAGPRIQKMFVNYLKEKFPDIKEFNRRFGLDYWSNRVDNWDDFPDVCGTINGSLAAEFEKFQRTIVTDFHHWQASVIREYKSPDQFITHNFDFEWHNFSFGLQPDTNQYDCATCMDVAGGDIYHPSQNHLTGAEITACGNILRGLKQDNYLILETQAQGTIEKLPYPGQLRLCAYSHLGNGANSVMYWHWHSIHNSFESYWKGILSHDFSENATYLEAKKVGNELIKIGDHLKNLKKQNNVALLLDHESLTGLNQFPTGELGTQSYNTIVRWIGDALYRMNVEYDMIYTQNMDLTGYKLILVPSLYSASEETLSKLLEYVEMGGHLVVTFRSGFSDEYLKIYADRQPHILNKCLGIHYDQFTIPENVSLKWAEKIRPLADQTESTSTVRDWMELITAKSANVLAWYQHQAWAPYAAVTENHWGKGKAYYIGCRFDDEAFEMLLHYIASEADIPLSEVHFPVVIKKGKNDFGRKIYYYLNYSGQVQSVKYNGLDGIDLLHNQIIQRNDTITLEPWDVRIIEASAF